MLATQSIKAWVQQEGCRQAYIIGLSINEDTKLEKGKEKGKTGSIVGLYKYLVKVAKALVVSEPIAIFYPGDRKLWLVGSTTYVLA